MGQEVGQDGAGGRMRQENAGDEHNVFSRNSLVQGGVHDRGTTDM